MTAKEDFEQYAKYLIVSYFSKLLKMSRKMRRKSDGRIYNLRFNGYHADDELNTILCLGAYAYTCKELFDNFELNVNGNWQPFGIEV